MYPKRNQIFKTEYLHLKCCVAMTIEFVLKKKNNKKLHHSTLVSAQLQMLIICVVDLSFFFFCSEALFIYQYLPKHEKTIVLGFGLCILLFFFFFFFPKLKNTQKGWFQKIKQIKNALWDLNTIPQDIFQNFKKYWKVPFWGGGQVLLNCSKTICYLPTPPLGQDMTQGQFLSGV